MEKPQLQERLLGLVCPELKITFSGNICEQLNYCPLDFHSACCFEIPLVSLSVGCIPLSEPLGDRTVPASSKVCLRAQMMKVRHWMQPFDAVKSCVEHKCLRLPVTKRVYRVQ